MHVNKIKWNKVENSANLDAAISIWGFIASLSAIVFH
jgi:hypothetical protein